MFCKFPGHFISLLVSNHGWDDTSPLLNADADNNKQDKKPEGIESGPQEYAAGTDAASSHETPEQSQQPPCTKHEDDYNLQSGYGTDTELEYDMGYVHSPGMPPEYAKYFSVQFCESYYENLEPSCMSETEK